jgi:AraC family transcriptional regulator
MIKNDILLINKFPDFAAAGFNLDAYNQSFKQSNIIINAFSADVSYPVHWGCLSVKCAFDGDEIYKLSDRRYAVNDTNYFICNDGEYYSSYIAARQPVESFNLNFSRQFVNTVAQSLLAPDQQLIDQPDLIKTRPNEFVQKLYRHGDVLSTAIKKLKGLTKNFDQNKEFIIGQYHVVLNELFLSQYDIQKKIQKITAVKFSTQKELFKRLHYAKDYIESCYMEDITLSQLANVACLNSAYLLRKFKQYFNKTPHQYLIQKRMAIAAGLLAHSGQPVTEVCFNSGYADLSSFCRLFKKHYQQTPENYRLANSKKSFLAHQ